MSSLSIPGNISPEDKTLIRKVFTMLQRGNEDAIRTSLKVVDSLKSRFIFQIHNPKDIDSVLVRNISLKITSLKSLEFDLQNGTITFECWRSNCETRKRGSKRQREIEEINYLPENIVSTLQSAANNNAVDLVMLQQIMLWIVNREENFCLFDLKAQFNSATGVYSLFLENFERVRLGFIRDLGKQWKTFIQNISFDWGTRSLVLNISK